MELMAVGCPFSTDVVVVSYFPSGLIVKSIDVMADAIGTVIRDDELYQ